MANIVQFENVGLRYGPGPETLTDISFTLERGAFHFITGTSGAGKTSLLRLLYLANRFAVYVVITADFFQGPRSFADYKVC